MQRKDDFAVQSDSKVALGQSIRLRRLALGLSQEKLAEAAGLHWTYISSIERGKRNVSLVNIVKIAKALGVSPSELLSEVR
jgi:transcriptional regulator with XRE-family HTH domain